jgi:hypothetical protein
MTAVTAMLSEALPPRSTMAVGLVYVGEEVGDVMVHVGVVAS